jgi:hypothetical protein
MIDLLPLTVGLITALIIGLGTAWNNRPMVLIAAKMTDRLQVWLLLVRDFTITLRIVGRRCVFSASLLPDHGSSPVCMQTLNSSLVLDKGFFRRYSERQI